MKFLQGMVILSLSFLLVAPLLVVESSSSTKNNITRGSSLSLNDPNPYWLSPSGNIAFGFYQWYPGNYVVGIWFVKSPRQTLVWTANRNDVRLQKPSSINFTNEGKLMLRMMPDNKQKPLIPDIQEPVSYAKLLDNGNFVLYGSDSQIVWESFDYPTDTILGGQKLKPGVDLFSGGYRLSVRQSDGMVGIYDTNAVTFSIFQGYGTGKLVEVVVTRILGEPSGPLTLNLDTSGNLYLDDVRYFYYLYENKNQKQGEEGSVYVYRATLNSGGGFNLYKERIDGGNISSAADNDKKSPSSLIRLWPNYGLNKYQKIGLVVFGVIMFFIVMAIVVLGCSI